MVWFVKCFVISLLVLEDEPRHKCALTRNRQQRQMNHATLAAPHRNLSSRTLFAAATSLSATLHGFEKTCIDTHATNWSVSRTSRGVLSKVSTSCN